MESEPTFQVGDFCDALHQGRYYKAKIKEVRKDGYFVHFHGWSKKWDCVVPFSDCISLEADSNKEENVSLKGICSKNMNKLPPNSSGCGVCEGIMDCFPLSKCKTHDTIRCSECKTIVHLACLQPPFENSDEIHLDSWRCLSCVLKTPTCAVCGRTGRLGKNQEWQLYWRHEDSLLAGGPAVPAEKGEEAAITGDEHAKRRRKLSLKVAVTPKEKKVDKRPHACYCLLCPEHHRQKCLSCDATDPAEEGSTTEFANWHKVGSSDSERSHDYFYYSCISCEKQRTLHRKCDICHDWFRQDRDLDWILCSHANLTNETYDCSRGAHRNCLAIARGIWYDSTSPDYLCNHHYQHLHSLGYDDAAIQAMLDVEQPAGEGVYSPTASSSKKEKEKEKSAKVEVFISNASSSERKRGRPRGSKLDIMSAKKRRSVSPVAGEKSESEHSIASQSSRSSHELLTPEATVSRMLRVFADSLMAGKLLRPFVASRIQKFCAKIGTERVLEIIERTVLPTDLQVFFLTAADQGPTATTEATTHPTT